MYRSAMPYSLALLAIGYCCDLRKHGFVLLLSCSPKIVHPSLILCFLIGDKLATWLLELTSWSLPPISYCRCADLAFAICLSCRELNAHIFRADEAWNSASRAVLPNNHPHFAGAGKPQMHVVEPDLVKCIFSSVHSSLSVPSSAAVSLIPPEKPCRLTRTQSVPMGFQ